MLPVDAASLMYARISLSSSSFKMHRACSCCCVRGTLNLGGEELTNGKAAGKLPLSEIVAIFSRNALQSVRVKHCREQLDVFYRGNGRHGMPQVLRSGLLEVGALRQRLMKEFLFSLRPYERCSDRLSAGPALKARLAMVSLGPVRGPLAACCCHQ